MTSEQPIPFLTLQPDEAAAAELQEAAREVIESGRYLNGPQTAAFERELAAVAGTVGATGVSNGLDAMRLTLRAWIEMGMLHPSDEALVAANTYIASIMPIVEMGLRPVLVEPSPVTLGIDWHRALEAVTPRTRLLIAVHLYGTPSWDAAIAAEMKSRGILILEDNAQAIGAAVKINDRWQPTGSLGDAAAFSFYPTKNIGALGDAGAVTSSDTELLATVRALANYGSDRRYHNIYQGYNCRLDEIQSAFLRRRLRHLEAITASRNATARLYDSAINNGLVTRPSILKNVRQVWHQYPVLCDRRDELRRHLADRGIGTDIHYAVPPHKQPCYRDVLPGSWPITERLADRLLSLPIAGISAPDAQRVADAVNAF